MSDDFQIDGDGSPPLISVVVPCYNAAATVASTLDSALALEGVTFEIIAVNDGSTDGTADVLQRYADRIRIVAQPNGGLSSARNYGASYAIADRLLFLDADDLMMPKALAKLNAALDSSGLGIAYGDAIAIDTDGNIISGKPMGFRYPAGNTMRALCAGTLFQFGAALMRRSLFQEVGGFDTALKSVEDLDFQYRAAAHTEFERVEGPVLYYRIAAAAMSRNYPLVLEQALKVHQTNAKRFGLWRAYPRHVLAGRCKAGFYFCGEHLGSRSNCSSQRTLEAHRCFRRHPWLLVLLAMMPVLRIAKRAVTNFRLARAP